MEEDKTSKLIERMEEDKMRQLPDGYCSTIKWTQLKQLKPVFSPIDGRISKPIWSSMMMTSTWSPFPELEKLTLIVYCFLTDALVIKAPKLKVLEITTFSEVKEIYSPLLTSFTYKSDEAWECANVNLPMLEQVYLDIHGPIYPYNPR
ncbi:hypothetical protein SASPL_127375 [Salvia splendens]|uniref:Uncharacterized protein n=1 Tax=Salvia splendens TaxID=180675 RepID=A0A8X8ZL55_SALSN|nr:hypothetical protein SASPL_127375 [Salvia splendens]